MYIQSFEIDKNCSDNDGNKETGCHKLAQARADSHKLKLYIYDIFMIYMHIQYMIHPFSKARAYLIFVTSTTSGACGEKSVMWRNFKFLYITDVEKSKIHPHVD